MKVMLSFYEYIHVAMIQRSSCLHVLNMHFCTL